MSNFEPLSKAQLKIFGVAELHQTYWNDDSAVSVPRVAL